MALAVINLLVRQFGAEECFSSSKLDVTCRQEGQHLLYKVKRDIFIGRLIHLVSAVWHIVLVPLFLALICTPLVFSFILLLPFIFPSGHRFILWSHRSLSPSSSHFLPSAPYVAHTEWIVTDFIPTPYPTPPPTPPLPSNFLPLCLLVFISTVDQLLLARAEGDLLAGPTAATQDMGPASPPRSCLVLQPVELPVCPLMTRELQEWTDLISRGPADTAPHLTASLSLITVILCSYPISKYVLSHSLKQINYFSRNVPRCVCHDNGGVFFAS